MITEDDLVTGMKVLKSAQLLNAPTFLKKDEYAIFKDIWLEALSFVEQKVFMKACKKIAYTHKYFPQLSEVKAACAEIEDGHHDIGLEVFEKIKQDMFRVSRPYVSDEDRVKAFEKIKDPAAREAARVFDWKACGLDAETKIGVHKAHFSKIYNNCRKRVAFNKQQYELSGEDHKQISGIAKGMLESF